MFPVTITIIPIKRVSKQHEHIIINLNCPSRERAKCVSEPVNGASEHSKVEICVASHQHRGAMAHQKRRSAISRQCS